MPHISLSLTLLVFLFIPFFLASVYFCLREKEVKACRGAMALSFLVIPFVIYGWLLAGKVLKGEFFPAIHWSIRMLCGLIITIAVGWIWGWWLVNKYGAYFLCYPYAYFIDIIAKDTQKKRQKWLQVAARRFSGEEYRTFNLFLTFVSTLLYLWISQRLADP